MLPGPARICLGVLCGAAAGCGAPSDPAADLSSRAPFVEHDGFEFFHFNGMSGELYYNEITGSGAAFFDYDNDGDLDVYAVQGHLLGDGKTLADASSPPHYPPPLTDRLYRNDLEIGGDGTPRLAFTDVTAGSGLAASAGAQGAAGYGMGVAAGDYDNDGWIDLYVTNFGANQLWRNRGDGTFEDVTEATASGDERWSSSAAFVDLDGDGWLDLYVTNYVDYDLRGHKPCLSAGGAPGYCGPLSYAPEPDRLLRNLGASGAPVRFEDVSWESGIQRRSGSGLGVVSADFNGDGWTDLYVANDLMHNHLWMSQGPGPDGFPTFGEEALLAGCAVDRGGRAQASMGVDVGDLDNDGDEDLFMTHLRDESSTLYLNDGYGTFAESAAAGLGPASVGFTGFGTAFFDYDNDGWLDLMAVNGTVKALEELKRAGDPFPLHQPNQLFHNRGDGTFEEIFDGMPAYSEVSRGLAIGDVDNDGDPDALVLNNHGPARLLINQVGQDAHWLGLRLVSKEGRDALGAVVELHRDGGPTRKRQARAAASYCSSNDPRVLFGLDDAVAGAARVTVHWPDGQHEDFSELEADRYHALHQGQGVPVAGGEAGDG